MAPQKKSSTWKDMLAAAISTTSGLGEHSLAQLATVRGPKSGHLAGQPACRTIIVRKFIDGRLYFTSDLRNSKFDDITEGATPYAELCWYFRELRTQFRLLGKISLVQDTDLRQQFWDIVNEKERSWWRLPNEDHAEEDEGHGGLSSMAMPEQYGLAFITPEYADVLEQHDRPLHQTYSTDQTDEARKQVFRGVGYDFTSRGP